MTENDEPLRVGIELEFPVRADDRPLTNYAETGVTREEVRDHTDGNRKFDLESVGGTCTHEGFMLGGPSGLEARTPHGGLPVDEIPAWYELTIEELESRFDVEFEPCGLLREGEHTIATVGLHTHLSPLTYDEAQRLYELSRQSWFQVFCGSSVTRTEAPVTREPYAGSNLRMEMGHGKGPVIGRRSDAHYEWRLPEPMLPENLELLCQFLDRFVEDFQNAENFAREYVEGGSDSVTSIRRAREVGGVTTDGINVERTSATSALSEAIA